MIKKIIGLLVIIILLLLVVTGIAVFLAYNKINSLPFKQLVEAKLIESTGMYVEIEKLHIGFFGTDATNIKIPAIKSMVPNENFLQIKDIKTSYNVFQFILSRTPVIIKRITIDEPTIIVREDPFGNLLLPFEKVRNSEASSVKPLVLQAPKIEIHNANILILSSNQTVLLKMQNANLHASYDKTAIEQKANGSITAQKITLATGISLTNFNSPIAFNNSQFSLDAMQATMYDGTFAGHLNINMATVPSIFNTKLTIGKMDLSKLSAELADDPNLLLGKLDLNFEGTGSLREPKNMTGQGNLLIPTPIIGKFKGYQNIANIIGMATGIADIKEGKFNDLTSSFTVGNQKLQFNTLNIDSDSLSIHLTGPILFDKTMELTGEASLSEDAVKSMQSLGNFLNSAHPSQNSKSTSTPTPSVAENIKLPVSISGSLTNPKISIDMGNLTSSYNHAPTPISNSTTEATPDTPQSPTTKEEKIKNLLNGYNDFVIKKKNPTPKKPTPAPQEPATNSGTDTSQD